MVEGFIIILNSWEMPWFIWPLDLCCDGRALLAPDLDHHRKVVYYTTTTFSSSSSSSLWCIPTAAGEITHQK
jgi:hypothetical protein